MGNTAVACFLEISAILLIYFVVSDYFWKLKTTNPKRRYDIWMGLSQGLLGVLLITKKVVWMEYYTLLDARTVVLCITGLLWGRLPMLISTAMMSAFTLWYAPTMHDALLQLIFTLPAIGLYEGVSLMLPRWKHSHYYTTLFICSLILQGILYACIAITPSADARAQLTETILPVWVLMPATVLMMGRMMKASLLQDEAQQEIRDTEDRFNMLARCSYDLFWELDSTGHIKYISGNSEKILGYTTDELIGRMPHDIITDNESLHTLLRYTNTVDESMFDSRLTFKHKKGYNVYCDSRGLKTFGPGGIPSGYMGIIRDITERHLHDKLTRSNEKIIREQNAEFRRLYEELKLQNRQINDVNAKLSEANEKISDSHKQQLGYITNISRELATPINTIRQLAEVLADNTASPADKSSATRQIMERCDFVKDLSDDLSDLDLILKGRMRIKISTGNVDELITEIYDQYYYKNLYVDKKPVTLNTTVDLPSDAHLIRADFRRIRQILSTLIEQAYKFTQIGKIWIRCKLCNNELQFSVADNGMGIPLGDKSDIFDPGRQEYPDQLIHLKLEHTAIDLNICKNLAELMGGRLWIESEPNNGTTVFFTVPFTRPAAISDGQYEASYSWDHHRILLMGCSKYNNALISSQIMRTGAKYGAILISDDSDSDNTYQQFSNYFSTISLMLIDERVISHPAAISLLKRYPNAPLIVTAQEPDISELCKEMDMKLNAITQ